MTIAAPGSDSRLKIAVIVPCYRTRRHILSVLAEVGPECDHIFVVDDGCPEKTGDYVEEQCRDPRVHVLRHDTNQGVGAAMCTGYGAALAERCEIAVKLDGDGQMDPRLIPALVAPLVAGTADYAKGNRFVRVSDTRSMPLVRLVGNAGLSFCAKLSTGYWDVFDPTNGFTAIHADVLAELPLDRIARRYFFESDMLHHLGLVRAVVVDVPMRAVYGDERSGLSPLGAIPTFGARHALNVFRRLFYSYLLHDFSAASLQLPLGLALLLFGTVFGAVAWYQASSQGVGAYAGTVMLAALPVIVGTQLVLAFLSFDVARVPRRPIHPLLTEERQVRHALAAPEAPSGAASAPDEPEAPAP